MSSHLERAKGASEWHATQEIGTSHSPDARTIPFLLAGILDALIALVERDAPAASSPSETS